MKSSQNQTILEHLFEYNTITSMEAYDKYGITRLAARIAELRKAGWFITTTQKSGKNRYGNNVVYAEYRLGKGENNG